MTADDFALDDIKSAFVEQYNSVGLPSVKPFTSGNCCISVKGGLMLTISGTPYGFQSPSNLAGDINCNPAGNPLSICTPCHGLESSLYFCG